MTRDENEKAEPEAVEWQPPTEAQAEEEDETARLKAELEQKKREAADAHDKYVRTYADFDNYRKRMQKELADARKYANEQIALELLSVVDHLALAIEHASNAGENNRGLREGVELVYKQLKDVLQKFGITPFSSLGERFDPSRHDALMQDTAADAAENTITKVFQEGYMYHDKVLRHAKVAVAKKPSSETEGESVTVQRDSEDG